MFTNKFALSAVFALAIAVVPQTARAGVFVSVNFAPPELPVYAQPAWPGDGYIWTPGYWGYGPEGYYWIPGTWVIAPTVGFLWTPGYWGWGGSSYVFHEGYWGPHVGFYGGVNYGFGYGGVGYEGGYWQGRTFNYNRSLNNISLANTHNVYNKPVSNGNNRISYNGGTGGVRAQASASEQSAARESHVAPTNVQAQHEQAASHQRTQLASVNHGQPAVTATPKPQPFAASPAAHQNQAAAGARQPERQRQPQTQAQQRPVPQPAARPQQQAQQRPAQQERPQPQAVRPAPQPAARQQQPQQQPQQRSAPQPERQQQPQRQAAPQQQQRPQQAAPQQHAGPGREERR